MGGKGRGKNKRNNNNKDGSAAALIQSFQKKKLKSIVFNISSFTDLMDQWFMVVHDESSGRPTFSPLFEMPQTSAPAAVIVPGSKFYYFPFKRGLYDNIWYLNMKKMDEDWVNSGLKLPTLCNCFIPGMFRDWLYLFGFNTQCNVLYNGCDDSRDKSVWGHVYNIKDGSQYSVEAPSPPPPSPAVNFLIVGPWKDEGLVVYTKQDNTLRVHNPVKGEWRTLVCDIIEDYSLLRFFSVHLCGDVFYTFNHFTFVVEAYDIRHHRRRPQVKFDPENDFPHPEALPPELCVIADGVLCFIKKHGDCIFYRSFEVDYSFPDPKPRSLHSADFPCDYGHLVHTIEVEATLLPSLEQPFSHSLPN